MRLHWPPRRRRAASRRRTAARRPDDPVRSTNGSRAMIFGASGRSSAVHQAPLPATEVAGTRPRSPFEAATAATTASASRSALSGTVKPKWKRAEFAHRGVAGGEIRVHFERRLHIGEGRDQDAPDALDRIEGQNPTVALDQPAHHLGLARGPEGGARFLRALDLDQAVDDLAALDQARVQFRVDAIDLGAQIRQRRAGRGVNLRRLGLRHRHGRRFLAAWCSARQRERKENIDRLMNRPIALARPRAMRGRFRGFHERGACRS